ncbi:MAG TPA: MFS transporter [Microbacteriaceae bacterium]|nr:MFS transporter [Microbacteriaceae bacterium]
MPTRSATRWPAIFLLVVAGMVGALEFAKVSTVFADVSAAYAADATLSAWFVSLPAVMTIVFGLGASVVASRVGFRRTLLISLALAVALSVIQAFVPPLPIFIITRILDGAVQLGIVIAAPVLILELAEPRARAFAMALWGSFFGCAFTLAGWIAPLLRDRFGLGSVFAAHAVLAAALIALIVVALPRTKGDGPSTATERVSFVAAHRSAYRSPKTVLPGAIFIFHTALYAIFVLYLPGFATPAQAAVLLIALPLSSIVGTIASGLLTSRVASAPVVLALGYIGVAASLVAAWAFHSVPGVPLSVPIVLMWFSGLVQGASFSLIPALTADPIETAEANGVLMQLGNLGTLIGPPLFAAVTVGMGLGLPGYTVLALAVALGGGALSIRTIRRVGARPVSA